MLNIEEIWEVNNLEQNPKPPEKYFWALIREEDRVWVEEAGFGEFFSNGFESNEFIEKLVKIYGKKNTLEDTNISLKRLFLNHVYGLSSKPLDIKNCIDLNNEIPEEDIMRKNND